MGPYGIGPDLDRTRLIVNRVPPELRETERVANLRHLCWVRPLHHPLSFPFRRGKLPAGGMLDRLHLKCGQLLCCSLLQQGCAPISRSNAKITPKGAGGDYAPGPLLTYSWNTLPRSMKQPSRILTRATSPRPYSSLIRREPLLSSVNTWMDLYSGSTIQYSRTPAR